MRTFLRLSLALSVTAFAGSASAQATMYLNVSANVAKSCQVAWASGPGNTATLGFGTYDPTVGSDTQSATAQTLNVKCSKNTAVTIALDNGQHFASSSRQMVGTSFSDPLAYGLYSSLSPLAAWPASQVWTAPNSSVKGFEFWGVIPNSQDVSQDTYGDQVTITLSW
jgi:spore coat protein U-like protein